MEGANLSLIMIFGLILTIVKKQITLCFQGLNLFIIYPAMEMAFPIIYFLGKRNIALNF